MYGVVWKFSRVMYKTANNFDDFNVELKLKLETNLTDSLDTDTVIEHVSRDHGLVRKH